MITVDIEQGMARDHGQVFIGDPADDGQEVIVNIELTDENDIGFTWGEGGKQISLYIPADRIKKLLEGGK